MSGTITLHLGRRFESVELHLHLPAAKEDIREKLTWLGDYAEDLSKSVEIRDVDCEIVGIRQYLRMADLSREGELEKLNVLAGMIEKMDERQRSTLWGALDSESINTFDDVLSVAEHLDDYFFLPNIRTDRELGQLLVYMGYKELPGEDQPYLSYRAIGAEYYAEHGGAFTPQGYVRRREPTQEHRPALITVHLRTLEPLGILGKTYPLDLPATEEGLDAMKDKLGVDYFTETIIDAIEFGQPYLEDLIPQDCFCVEDANELALRIEEMMQKDGELLKYLSLLSLKEPETLGDALRLAMELDNYERVTEFEDGVQRTEYGLIRRLNEPVEKPDFGQKMM